METLDVRNQPCRESREEAAWRRVSAPLYFLVDFAKAAGAACVLLVLMLNCGVVVGLASGVNVWPLADLIMGRLASFALADLIGCTILAGFLLLVEVLLERRWQARRSKRSLYPGPWA